MRDSTNRCRLLSSVGGACSFSAAFKNSAAVGGVQSNCTSTMPLPAWQHRKLRRSSTGDSPRHTGCSLLFKNRATAAAVATASASHSGFAAPYVTPATAAASLITFGSAAPALATITVVALRCGSRAVHAVPTLSCARRFVSSVAMASSVVRLA
jgi:hypothetical protein